MAVREGRRSGIFEATLFTVACLVILSGLGVWQLDRKVWKENLIASLTERLAKTPQDMPPREEWPRLSAQDDEFRRVAFPAEFIRGEEALVYSAGSALRKDVKGPGYWVFAPARLAGGSVVVVNRGFVPLERKDPASRAEGAESGIVEIVGVLRWPESRGFFTPADDVKANIWYLRDIHAMDEAKKWNAAAPFYIDQEAPVPPSGLPLPGKLEVHLPDNHLQYAITWFGLALALAGVYVVWFVGRIRKRS
jgi:surfeit locus 1 family protein